MPQVFDWIAHHARHTPEKIAAFDLATQRTFTYAQFDERISRLASFMQQEWRIKYEERVAVLAQNCVEYFEVQFACGRLGAIMVPLNWRLALPELEYLLADCEPSALIHDAACAATAQQLQIKRLAENFFMPMLEIGARAGYVSSYESAVQSRPLAAPNRALEHDEAWAILYTSGTTGRPKGALLTHGMAFWNAVNIGMAVGLTHESVSFNVLPTFHTGGLNLYANPTFHCGGTAVIAPGFDPEQTLEWLAHRGVTHFFGVPTIYLLLSQHPSFEHTALSRVRSFACGGAAMPIALLHRYEERGVRIRQGFGMTETSPTVFLIAEAEALRKAGSVGKPVLHTAVRLVDARGQDVARGEAGELWIKGPNVTPGYWQRPEVNAASFTEGWFHSGDVARQDEEGFYYIVDRVKDMFISGGENVYPAEIEQALYELPQVAEAAVIGVADEKWGEVGKAFLVLKTGAALSAEQVLAHCRAKLAKFKIPKQVVFVDSLPHTAAGKVLKHELRKQEK
jgi:fatty-acyl-CoA synthase